MLLHSGVLLCLSGNGTVGLEILEDLPSVDTIISPFGGGGCICGVASTMRALKPDTCILACEVQTAAPLSASLKAGHPVALENHKPSFVDGIGGQSVFPEMWSLAESLIDDSIVVSPREICDALKLLVERNCVIAEGAGAAPVAAALREEVLPGNIVCIVSGGNIDTHKLVTVLQGGIPD